MIYDLWKGNCIFWVAFLKTVFYIYPMILLGKKINFLSKKGGSIKEPLFRIYRQTLVNKAYGYEFKGIGDIYVVWKDKTNRKCACRLATPKNVCTARGGGYGYLFDYVNYNKSNFIEISLDDVNYLKPHFHKEFINIIIQANYSLL